MGPGGSAGGLCPGGGHLHGDSGSPSAGQGDRPARRGAGAEERGRHHHPRHGQGEAAGGEGGGFNARTEEYEDLIKAGIIDPTKVVRTALQNAASVAGLLLTTEAMVAEKPKEKKPATPPMPHGAEDF